MKQFSGQVIYGKQLGRTLGFPTANLETDCAPELSYGVYAVLVRAEGRIYRGMMNVGAHPTAPEGRPTIEVHILDFEGDLYGKTIEITVLDFLRGESRFASLDALVDQLKYDKNRVRNLIGEDQLK